MSAKEKRQKELDELNALLRPVQQAPGKGENNENSWISKLNNVPVGEKSQ